MSVVRPEPESIEELDGGTWWSPYIIRWRRWKAERREFMQGLLDKADAIETEHPLRASEYRSIAFKMRVAEDTAPLVALAPKCPRPFARHLLGGPVRKYEHYLPTTTIERMICDILGVHKRTVAARKRRGVSEEDQFRLPILAVPKPDPNSIRSRAKAAGKNYQSACRKAKLGKLEEYLEPQP